jgi:formylglycine-generating enzyme required for sulfatase activity
MRRRIQWALVCGVGALAALVQGLSVLERPRPLQAAAESRHRTYVETIPGSKVKFRMVAVPGGTFLMGSPEGEKGHSPNEGPQHPVAVAPFWMGACEVTWDEYDLYWHGKPGKRDDKEPDAPADADAVTRPTPPYIDETWEHGRAGHPVLGITHHAAMQYCRWLSVKTGKTYRLPTEAEWEYACRAGTKTAYSFGDDPKKLGEYAWFADNSGEHTGRAGTKKPNRWGLYDMYGNVAEWCVDHYDAGFYSRFPVDQITLGPVLPPTERRFRHVVRGGSWADEARECRSAARRGSDKTWLKSDPNRPPSLWWLSDADFVGFRIVRPVREQENLIGLRSRVTNKSR